MTLEHNVSCAWPKTFVKDAETHILQRRTVPDLFVIFWCKHLLAFLYTLKELHGSNRKTETFSSKPAHKKPASFEVFARVPFFQDKIPPEQVIGPRSFEKKYFPQLQSSIGSFNHSYSRKVGIRLPIDEVSQPGRTDS